VLSGGEKNRVGMTSVLLQKANLLFLDEPTNHLDIASKEILLKALQNYQGTILFVSHDRDFVNKLATHIIELTPTGVISYQGDYDGYLYYKNTVLNKAQGNSGAGAQNTGHNSGNSTITGAKNTGPAEPKKAVNPKHLKELKKKIGAAERTIHNLEKNIPELELSFADLRYGTPEYVGAEQKLRTLKADLKNQTEIWEKLQQELEQLEA
jgi:ATP-binding cassette subfamily F protein 3